MRDAIRTAVVGVGRLGSFHSRIHSELPNSRLVAVVDADASRAEAAAAKYGCIALTDWRDLVGKVEAASVATPTSLHAEVGCGLLDAGIHVLIEKPLASTLEEADRLIAAARKSGAKLQVGHVERFNPAVMAAEKVIGTPLYIECHRLSPFSFRSADIDVILDLMIHDIDIIRHLVRSPLEKIDAVGIPLVSGTDDIASARLQFENGCVANVTASRISAKKMRKIRIFSKEGYLSLDYGEKRALLFQPSEQVRAGSVDLKSVPPEALADPLPYFLQNLVRVSEIAFDEHEPLKKEIESFLECVASGSSPAVPGEDGKAAMEIAAAVKASIKAHLDSIKRRGKILSDLT